MRIGLSASCGQNKNRSPSDSLRQPFRVSADINHGYRRGGLDPCNQLKQKRRRRLALWRYRVAVLLIAAENSVSSHAPQIEPSIRLAFSQCFGERRAQRRTPPAFSEPASHLKEAQKTVLLSSTKQRPSGNGHGNSLENAFKAGQLPNPSTYSAQLPKVVLLLSNSFISKPCIETWTIANPRRMSRVWSPSS
jgi:hypothetical protein